MSEPFIGLMVRLFGGSIGGTTLKTTLTGIILGGTGTGVIIGTIPIPGIHGIHGSIAGYIGTTGGTGLHGGFFNQIENLIICF